MTTPNAWTRSRDAGTEQGTENKSQGDEIGEMDVSFLSMRGDGEEDGCSEAKRRCYCR